MTWLLVFGDTSDSTAFTTVACLVFWLVVVPLLITFLIMRNKNKSKSAAAAVYSPTSAPSGVFFGVQRNMPVGKNLHDDGHVLVIGGAGSGKTTCIAIPTLRDTWHAPALVVDIKGELLAKSQRRSAYVFNPTNLQALGYDPFYLLRESHNPIPDIREIALTLCPTSHEVKDPFWIQASQNILTGHLLFSFKQGATFIQALRILQSTEPEIILEVGSSDADAKVFLVQYAHLKTETLSGIFAELSNKVMTFATDPEIQTALSKGDIITPQLLEQGHDIFLQIPEYKLEQWKSLTSLIVQQFLRHFERRPEYNTTPILFMLDEFARLGKIEAVISGLATLRSKKVTIMPIIQSLAQLDAIYGHEQRKVICDNCGYKAILNATDADTQKYFSQLVGTMEREKKSYSEGVGQSSVTTSTEEKAIIRPEEFAYLKDIVLLTPYGFTRVQKMPYYQTAPQPVAAPIMQRQLAPLPQQQQIAPPTPPYQSRPQPVSQSQAPLRQVQSAQSQHPDWSGSSQQAQNQVRPTPQAQRMQAQQAPATGTRPMTPQNQVRPAPQTQIMGQRKPEIRPDEQKKRAYALAYQLISTRQRRKQFQAEKPRTQQDADVALSAIARYQKDEQWFFDELTKEPSLTPAEWNALERQVQNQLRPA